MPSGITVHDYCLGAHWTYIVADCGMGLAKTVRGGGKSRFKQSPVDVDLKTLAALAKAERVTFVGSTIPFLTISINSPVKAL